MTDQAVKTKPDDDDRVPTLLCLLDLLGLA
jgi:hypothetical protein